MGTQSVFEQLPTPLASVSTDDQGVIIMESDMALLPYARCVGDWLEKWAQQTPDAILVGEPLRLANPEAEGWRTLTYQAFRDQVRQLAQGMLTLGLSPQRPVLILSGNSIDHALIKMAAMHVGVPVTSLSVAYSMFAGKYDRLVAAVERLTPGLIFAEQGQTFAQPLASLKGDHQVVVSSGLEALADVQQPVMLLATLADAQVTALVDERFAEINPETPAKYMLTSGSTGHPKIVVVTQRMMCSNQQMIAQCYPFVESTPPVVLDWLPWSHTFGTNHNFNLVLRNGGSLYIDDGRPMPGMVEKTVANIREIKPTLFFNVPKGYEALLPMLQQDKSLASAFFANLQLVFYAAASLSEPVWKALKALAAEQGKDPLFSTEWGSTETAPANTNVNWRLDKAGNIGIPMPGVALKFVPNGSKLELRVKGPNVFKEYLHDREKTIDSFDLDGFYKIGDAGRLADPTNPSAGVLFDGRVSEDFKLSTGTWVCVATMRKRVVEAFDGLVSDALITGHDQDYIGLVVFPSPGIYQLGGDSSGQMTAADLLANPPLQQAFVAALDAVNAQAKGSSQRIAKVVLADQAPSLDLGEVTDKGNLNQRKLLDTRKDLIASLYADNHSPLNAGAMITI